MSESEKFEAQGRAHDALKKARTNAATINTSLSEYGGSLNKVAGLITQFLRDPLDKSGAPLWSHLTASINALSNPDQICRLVKELAEETERIKNLEAQIAQF